MNITIENNRDIIIIKVDGNLSLEETDKLRKVIDGLIDNDFKGLILDLANTSFIDSAGIDAIVHTYKRLYYFNKKFILSNLSRKSREVFALTKLDKILITTTDLAEATKILEINNSD